MEKGSRYAKYLPKFIVSLRPATFFWVWPNTNTNPQGLGQQNELKIRNTRLFYEPGKDKTVLSSNSILVKTLLAQGKESKILRVS